MGDTVAEDEVVCEIETDKVKEEIINFFMTVIVPNCSIKCFATPVLQTSVQVPSPAAGVIEELLIPDGGKVEGGTPLFKLRKGG